MLWSSAIYHLYCLHCGQKFIFFTKHILPFCLLNQFKSNSNTWNFCLKVASKSQKQFLVVSILPNSKEKRGKKSSQDNVFWVSFVENSKNCFQDLLTLIYYFLAFPRNTCCMKYQKYGRLRCLLHVKGLVICFLRGWLAAFFSSDKMK